jgi:hypothetical protein
VLIEFIAEIIQIIIMKVKVKVVRGGDNEHLYRVFISKLALKSRL